MKFLFFLIICILLEKDKNFLDLYFVGLLGYSNILDFKTLTLYVGLNLFKKNIERKDSKQLVKKLINSKKVRKQIIQLKHDIDRPDFGR